MPRPTKKGKTKGAKAAPVDQTIGNGADSGVATAAAVAEPPPEELREQPAMPAEETVEKRTVAEKVTERNRQAESADRPAPAEKTGAEKATDKDRIATSL